MHTNSTVSTRTGCAVTWKRARFRRKAHAFAKIDLDAGFPVIEPIAPCGRFAVRRLVSVPSEHPNRCLACLRAAPNQGIS